jgi:cell fate regulator YaaT (PSP1 superfamily)
MGCTSCSSGGGSPKGCKNNGTCSSGGCNKLGVFDWLANMDLPSNQAPYDILEIRFKNSRKAFYRNAKNLPLNVGDVVVVEVSPGYDIGVVSVVGELARIQVKKKEVTEKPGEMKKILRVATQEDIDKWIKARSLESEVMFQARTLAVNLGLEMKISDVEYQGDLTKATFFYTAEGRVDFRQLIKDMADKFKIRIEMRQIGSRQEAQRLGGIGSCGRELCCSTWLSDFRSVSTSAARYQQLSLNPQKLAGQCGKLKCCLNYELDSYLDAIKSFPAADVKIHTEKGSAFHIKTDVFKRQMWFLYEGGSGMGGGLVALTPERVKEIQQMNKNGNKPQDLKAYEEEVLSTEPDYDNVVGQDSLNRFDNKFKSKNKKKKRNPNAPQNQNGGQQNTNPNQQVKPNQNPNAKPNPNQQKPVGENKGQAVVAKTPNPNQQQNRVPTEGQAGTGEVKKKNNKRRFNKKPGNNNNNPKPE